MKKMILLALLSTSTVFAQELSSYQEAVDANMAGKKITYVVDWDKCKTNYPDITPNFISRYTPNHINIDKSGFIVSHGFAYTHSIRLAPELGPVNQAYIYLVNKNNELHITDRFLDPITWAEKVPAAEVVCQLGTGFKVFA